eukprot:SAG22_NODE_16594_length_322_cov_0.699552_1_plen_27_part_10
MTIAPAKFFATAVLTGSCSLENIMTAL